LDIERVLVGLRNYLTSVVLTFASQKGEKYPECSEATVLTVNLEAVAGTATCGFTVTIAETSKAREWQRVVRKAWRFRSGPGGGCFFFFF